MGKTGGITREFEAPRIINDRTGAVERAYRSLEKPASKPGNPIGKIDNDPSKTKAPPLGRESINRHFKTGGQFAASTKIYVNGAPDPEATARAVAGTQKRVNGKWADDVGSRFG